MNIEVCRFIYKYDKWWEKIRGWNCDCDYEDLVWMSLKSVCVFGLYFCCIKDLIFFCRIFVYIIVFFVSDIVM